MFITAHNPDILSFSTAQYSVVHHTDTSSFLILHDSYGRELKCFSPKRKVDFLAGRYCASKALELSGMLDTTEIPILPNRSPDWPEGWVGSITHTEGFASAAVARKNELLSIGIDSERIMACETANEVIGLTLLPSEILYWEIELKSSINFETYLTLVFSAKESVFKCLNPIVGVFIEFHDVELFSVNLNSRQFSFKLLKTFTDNFSMGRSLSGSFEISLPYIHTAVELNITAPAQCFANTTTSPNLAGGPIAAWQFRTEKAACSLEQRLRKVQARPFAHTLP